MAEGILGGKQTRSPSVAAAYRRSNRVSIASAFLKEPIEKETLRDIMIEERKNSLREAPHKKSSLKDSSNPKRMSFKEPYKKMSMKDASTSDLMQSESDDSLHVVTTKKKRRCTLFSCNNKKQKQRCTRSNFDLDLAKEELVECCLTHMMDTYKVHLNRMRGIEVVNMIVDKASINDVTSSMAVHIIWACLSCMHHFLLRLNTTYGYLHWSRRRDVRRAVRTYERALKFLVPDMYLVVLNAIITFFEEANLWQVEYLCTNLLKRLLYLTDNYGDSLVAILTLAENKTQTNITTAREIINVIHEIETESDWTLLNEEFVRTLLNMYYCSTTPNLDHEFIYKPLRPILDMCIRNMSDYLGVYENRYIFKYFLTNAAEEEILEDVLLEFGTVLDHVGNRLRTTCNDPILIFAFLPDLILLIGSKDVLYSLLGHRLLHQLFDIGENRSKLKEPLIFFIEIDFKLVVGEYNRTLEILYKSSRESIQTTFISSALNHRHHKIMMEHTFLSIALLIIQVPCAYTAAAAVCIAMALQTHALDDGYDMHVCHWIHATVMGIMSLVAYIHKADIFYDYVISIMEQRAKNAPHLNPPLKSSYKYAQHHVLWNDPGLFFEHVNCRYGLMKCFMKERSKPKK